MFGEATFSKYQYIINIPLETLGITEELIQFILKDVNRNTNTHWESIVS